METLSDTAAKFAIKCLEFQMKNKQSDLKSISISYEELTTAPEEFKKQLSEFIPDLTGLQHDIEFKAHNFKRAKMKMTNLNATKIDKLSNAKKITPSSGQVKFSSFFT